MKQSLSQEIGNMRDRILDKSWKKIVVALILTVLLVGGLGFAYIWFTPSLKDQFFGQKVNTRNPYALVLSETDKKLLDYNPVEMLIKKRTVKDLPIYPKSWQKQYFSESEIKDANTSGPDSDADRDGLANKEEYIYGSNPRNPDTLGAGGKDGEYVQAGNNPLSGLPLDGITDFSYFFLNTDLAIIESLNDDLEVLEEEGISIPVLYEEARKVDFSSEMTDINLNIIQDPTRDASINYLNQRLVVIKDIVSSNYFSSLSNIYQIKESQQLIKLKGENRSRIIVLEGMGIPKQEVEIHRAIIYFFKQIDRLIDLRVEVVEKGLQRKEYDQKQKDIILRSVWAHRKINDAINQLSPNK